MARTKLKFKSIISRLSGISTPVFGVSWNPPKLERDAARLLLAFLEDRRVLYNPSGWEEPHHCVESVLQIRAKLTELIGDLPEKASLAPSLRAMRMASRRFLDSVQALDQGRRLSPGHHQAPWDFFAFSTALGELRGVFGIHVAQIAVQYGIDVEAELASILPAATDHDAA
jgi:hypothetical protein